MDANASEGHTVAVFMPFSLEMATRVSGEYSTFILTVDVPKMETVCSSSEVLVLTRRHDIISQKTMTCNIQFCLFLSYIQHIFYAKHIVQKLRKIRVLFFPECRLSHFVLFSLLLSLKPIL
jgi:hypothetical protein